MPDFIYPRDFFHAQDAERQRGLCFVLMPFADEHRQVYDGVIKPTVEESGMQCLRADDIYSPRPILVTVMENIARAELVIADLSGKNPNVFYEVGLAHVVTRNEQVILISQTTEDVPFDLRHLRLIIYEDSPEGLEKLTLDLQRAFQALGLTQGREDAVISIQEANNNGGAEVELASASTWEWAEVTVAFAPTDERFEDFKGRFGAGLLEWVEFEDISDDGRTISFPGGTLDYGFGFPASPRLVFPKDTPIPLDGVVRVVGLGYEDVSYQVARVFDPGALIRQFRSLGLVITYASSSQITVSPDPAQGMAFIDLLSQNSHMVLTLRAPEGLQFRASAGVMPFADMLAFLNGTVEARDFTETLFRYRYGT